MDQTAVIRIRLDTGNLPAASAQAAQAVGQIGAAGQVSARQTAAAMRQLPAQFTDIATQIAGGQNPLLILLQQGGQIKDSFGGVGAAVRGIGAAISPAAVGIGALAAGVGALGLAAYQGAQQSAQLRDTIALTGNAAGLTADRVKALAESTAAASGQTVGSAREIALALASTGRTTAGVIESQAKAVARIADLSGESAAKVAAGFAAQIKAPAEFAAKLNEQYNFLNVEQFKRIQQLEREGKAVEAVNVTNDLLTKSLAGQRTELGYLEQALENTSKWWSRMWASALNVGRTQGPIERIGEISGELRNIFMSAGGREPAAGTFSAGRVAALRAQIEGLSKLALEQQAAADRASAGAEKNRRGIAGLLGTKPGSAGDALSAIRDPQAQYKADFLRSEKAVYEEIEKERRQAAADALKDPLGDFITEKVLPADRERQERRLAQQQGYLQDLVDANERAGAQLIEDEEARGRALIELDRKIAVRRLEAMGLDGDARSTAEGLINRRAGIAAEQFGAKLGDSTYSDVRDALAHALRDTHNPARAFAEALGNAVYTRLTTRIADAMATAAVGKDGMGGIFGEVLKMFGVAGGGTAAPGTTWSPEVGEMAGLATGTNFVPRDMFALLHRGEAVVPAKYNHGASGRAGMVVQPNITIAIDARADSAQMQQMVQQGVAQGMQATFEALREQGRL